jgi:hypothetical protein
VSLSDEYVQALGRVVGNAAAMEVELAFSIWRLLGVDQLRGQAVTTKQSARKLIHMLSTLCHQRLPSERLTQIENLIRQARALSDRRNRLLHNPFLEDGTQLTIRTRKGRVVYENPGTNVETINALADDLKDFNAALLDALSDYLPGPAD